MGSWNIQGFALMRAVLYCFLIDSTPSLSLKNKHKNLKKWFHYWDKRGWTADDYPCFYLYLISPKITCPNEQKRLKKKML